MRWVSLALVVALSGCALKRPNHTTAYVIDSMAIGFGGIGLITHDDTAGGDDPGFGPVEHVYMGMVAAGAVGIGVNYLLDSYVFSSDSSEY